MDIVIIGTGNVATVIGRLLLGAGHRIVQVFGRNVLRTGELAKELHGNACNSWDDINKTSDFYLVAISDGALYELEQHLRLPEQVVLHTAGSVSREVLKNITQNYGVLYPLQSVRKEMKVLTGVPLLVDASNQQTLAKVVELAQQISASVSLIDDEKRIKLHLAAVCVNNFANHLYQLAEDFCTREHVDFKLLLPIVSETARRIELVSPHQALTGPAMRNDQVTINRHLEILGAYPLFHSLYEQMTASIRAFNNV